MFKVLLLYTLGPETKEKTKTIYTLLERTLFLVVAFSYVLILSSVMLTNMNWTSLLPFTLAILNLCF